MEKMIQSAESDAESANAVQRGVDSAGAALHSGINRVVDPTRQAVDRMSSTAHEAVDKLASNASHTASRFSEQTRYFTDAPARALETSKSWIQERPLEAVGAALALGYIFGRLSSR